MHHPFARARIRLLAGSLLLAFLAACPSAPVTKKSVAANSGNSSVASLPEGLFTDIVPVGNGTILEIAPDMEEIKGGGSMAGKSADVHFTVKDLGEGKAQVQFQVTGAVNSDLDAEAPYTKTPGKLVVNSERAIVTQTRYEKECGMMGCSGPGLQLHVKELPNPETGFKGAEHLLRFEFTD